MIRYFIQKGAAPEKLILGMPTYGKSWTLTSASGNGLNAPGKGAGQAGEATGQGGLLAYFEICDRVKNKGWTVIQDPKERIGPYAYKGTQWVSYDDKAIIRAKVLANRDKILLLSDVGHSFRILFCKIIILS